MKLEWGPTENVVEPFLCWGRKGFRQQEVQSSDAHTQAVADTTSKQQEPILLSLFSVSARKQWKQPPRWQLIIRPVQNCFLENSQGSRINLLHWNRRYLCRYLHLYFFTGKMNTDLLEGSNPQPIFFTNSLLNGFLHWTFPWTLWGRGRIWMYLYNLFYRINSKASIKSTVSTFNHSDFKTLDS